eukprot:1469424-Lingulodinium_polyedra.AAC.1
MLELVPATAWCMVVDCAWMYGKRWPPAHGRMCPVIHMTTGTSSDCAGVHGNKLLAGGKLLGH